MSFVTKSGPRELHTLLPCADRRSVAKETFGVPMLFNLFLSVSRDLSGTGILGIMLASILGILLIWDARDMGETLKQRNQ